MILVPLHLYIIPESLSAAVALQQSLRCVTTDCVPEKSAPTSACLLAAIHMALMSFVGVRLVAARRGQKVRCVGDRVFTVRSDMRV